MFFFFLLVFCENARAAPLGPTHAAYEVSRKSKILDMIEFSNFSSKTIENHFNATYKCTQNQFIKRISTKFKKYVFTENISTSKGIYGISKRQTFLKFYEYTKYPFYNEKTPKFKIKNAKNILLNCSQYRTNFIPFNRPYFREFEYETKSMKFTTQSEKIRKQENNKIIFSEELNKKKLNSKIRLLRNKFREAIKEIMLKCIILCIIELICDIIRKFTNFNNSHKNNFIVIFTFTNVKRYFNIYEERKGDNYSNLTISIITEIVYHAIIKYNYAEILTKIILKYISRYIQTPYNNDTSEDEFEYTSIDNGNEKLSNENNIKKHNKERRDNNGNNNPHRHTQRNIRQRFIMNHTLRYGIINFNIENIMPIEDEDEWITRNKIMIYKTIISDEYFIENISFAEDQSTLIITLITMPNEIGTIVEMMENEGINEYETELIEKEATSNEIDIFTTSMKERQEMLRIDDAQYILKYTWTNGNREKTYAMLEEWGEYTMKNINIPLREVSKFPPQNEGEKWELMKNIMQLPIKIKYVVNNYDEENQTFSITVRATELQQFIEQAITHDIEFTLESEYIITDDNVMNEIDAWLLNKAILETIKVSKPKSKNKKTHIGFKLTITNPNTTDPNEVRKYIYNITKEEELYVYNVEYKESLRELQIDMLATWESYNKAIKQFAAQEGEYSIFGSYNMQEEDASILKELKEERRKYTLNPLKHFNINIYL